MTYEEQKAWFRKITSKNDAAARVLLEEVDRLIDKGAIAQCQGLMRLAVQNIAVADEYRPWPSTSRIHGEWVRTRQRLAAAEAARS